MKLKDTLREVHVIVTSFKNRLVSLWSTNTASRLVRVELLFLVICLGSGLYVISKLPPMWGADETSHTARIYQISQGHLYAVKDAKGMYGGNIPYNLAALTRFVYADLATGQGYDGYPTHEKLIDEPSIYTNFKKQKFDSKTSPAQFTGAASYSPLAYLGSIPGAYIARTRDMSIGSMIFMSRIGGLILYALLVTAALYVLRQHSARWIIFVIALLPMSVFQASIISTDSLAIASAIAGFACLIKLFGDNKRGVTASTAYLICLFISVCLATHIKPVYIFLSLPALALPVSIWSGRRRMLAYKIGLILACLLVTGIWLYSTRSINAAGALSNNQQYAEVINTAAQAKLVALQDRKSVV